MDNHNGCIAHSIPAETTSLLLSINQIKKTSGLSRKFIEKQIKDGKLPAIRFSSRAIRIDSRDLEAFISVRKTATPKQEGTAT